MLRRALVGLMSAVLVVALPTVAEAAQKTNYTLSYCSNSNASFVGYGTNTLTNGTLRMGWCRNGANMITHTVEYDKDFGNSVRVQFGYRWADYNSLTGNLTNTSSVHWDQSSTNWITLAAGEIGGARFSRAWPGEAPPNNQNCMQGVMKTTTGDKYYTHTVCR